MPDRTIGCAYGSKGRLAARRQPTDQYDGALDTTGDHIRAAQSHWPTSPGTSNQRSGVGTHLPMQSSDVPRGISSVQSLNTERLPASPPVWASPTTRVLHRRRYRSRFARPQLLPTRPMSYWQLEPTFPIAIVCSKHNKRPCVRILSPLSFGLQRFAVQRALRPSTPHRNDFHLQLLGLTWPSHHQ